MPIKERSGIVVSNKMEKTIVGVSTEQKFEEETLSLFSKIFETRLTSFEDQLSKFETI